MLIPLRARDGSVRAHAIVDDEVFKRFAERPWCLDSYGYAYYSTSRAAGKRRRTVYLHREILGLTVGDGLEGDHRNGNRLDCRRSNLRIVTKPGNAQNRLLNTNSTSGYRGVSWDKRAGKWRAYAYLNKRKHNLGLHDHVADAAVAAATFRAAHMPFSAEASVSV